MYKAYLFDYGGVLTTGGVGHELTDHLADNLGITPEKAWEYLEPVFTKFIKGEISEEEVWVYIESKYGQKIEEPKKDIWNNWDKMKISPEMNELLASLKSSGKIVGLLSNVIPVTEKSIRSNGGYDSFDFTVLSNEVHLAKPDIKIYQLAIKKIQEIDSSVIPEEIVFIDDQEKNLVPASSLGIKTVLAINQSQIIEDINQLEHI